MPLNIFWCLLTKEKWNVADFVSFHRLTERIVLPAAAFIRYGSAHTSTSCCFFFHARRFAYCAYSFIISCFRTAFCCFKYWVTLDYMYSCENLWTFLWLSGTGRLTKFSRFLAYLPALCIFIAAFMMTITYTDSVYLHRNSLLVHTGFCSFQYSCWFWEKRCC